MGKKLLIALNILSMTLSPFEVFATSGNVENVVEESHVVEEIHDHSSHTHEEVHTEEYDLVAEPIIEEVIHCECGKEEHLHTDDCYETYRVLTCDNKDDTHTHTENCFVEYKFLTCEKEEHSHNDSCINSTIEEISEESIEEIQESPLDKAKLNKDGYYLTCGQEEHKHTPECFQLVQNVICENEDADHIHDDLCFDSYYITTCERKEHTHTEECIGKRNLFNLLSNPLKAAKPSVGTITVEDFYIEFFRGARKVGNKNVWFPYNSSAGHEFAFRVNFAFSGIGEIPENTVEIRIPKEILKDSNGNYLDRYEVALSRFDDYEEEDQLVWKEEADDIVIFNRLPLDGGYNGYFEVGYYTLKSTFNYSDSDKTYPDENILGEFSASMHLQVENEGLDLNAKDENDSEVIPVWMDSKVEINSVSKRYPNNIYYRWQSTWGEKPADADDYYYLVWEVVTDISDSTSQPYTFTIVDEPRSEDVEPILYKLNGKSTWQSNATIVNQTLTGKRFDFVLTRHKIATYGGTDKEIVNKATVQMVGEFGYDEMVSASSTNTYRSKATAPIFQLMDKEDYSFYQTWNDSWGVAPEGHENYEYIIWRVESRIKNPANWPILLEIVDTPITTGLEVVGQAFDNPTNFSNEDTKVITTNGTRYDYVLTRFVPEACVDMLFENMAATTILPNDEGHPFNVQTLSDQKSYTVRSIPYIHRSETELVGRYNAWDSSWGEVPADAEDYYYIVWSVKTNITNPRGEPYNFTLTDTPPQGLEIVGYKLSGDEVYSPTNIQNDLTASGERVDYVLTRYAKSTYDGTSYTFNNSARVQLSNSTGCVWSPVGTVSSRSYSYTEPVFSAPKEDFTFGKYRRYYYQGYLYKHGNIDYDEFDGYISYDLEDLKLGLTDKVSGITYDITAETNPYFYTRNANEPVNQPTSYGQRLIKAELTDDTVKMDNVLLESGDYQFDSVAYTLTQYDASYSTTSKYYSSVSPTYTNETLRLQIKVNGEWIDGGELLLADNTNPTLNTDYVSSFTRTNVSFKNGVEGYRLILDDSKYYVRIAATPSLSILNSEKVLNYLQERSVIDVRNDASFTLYKEGNVVKQGTSFAIDMVRSMPRDSQIKKTVVGTTNNVKKKKYTVTWSLYMDELFTDLDDSKKPIEQDGGTFYDLLPISSNLDIDSVIVKTNTGYLKEYEYDVEQIPNFRDTGRSLLIVNVKKKFDNAQVFYDTVHTWDSIKDYGQGLYNPVAFKTGNEAIAQGYPDNGGEIEDKDLFNNLDDTVSTEKRFIYDDEYYDIAILTAAASGLTKKVRNIDDSLYTYDATTTVNGDYMYRLRYMNSFTSQAKNIILMDSLENYVAPDDKLSDWHGTLTAIDTSQLEERGIAPVIYLSSIENLNLEENNDITDTNVWTPMSEFGDLSNAKALAIDMRKTTENEDFVLEEGSSVTVILYMKAPNEVVDLGPIYPETYNNIYVKNTVIDRYGGEQEFFIHQDYTTVRYRVTQDFLIKKVNEENLEEVISGISFRLFGTSDYGTETDITLTTDQEGRLTFKNIEKGTYKLFETEGVKDFLEDHTEHTLQVTSDRGVLFDGVALDAERLIQITNKPRIYSEINLMKRREGDSADDVETKQILANAEIGDKVTYQENEYVVIDKTDTKVQLEKSFTTKYAVQIYGIEYDTLEDGSTAGLTFGPAIGQDFMNSYISHVPSGTTSSGNDHRCVHNDDWETIIYWNSVDPYVYEQCIAENCTHSIKLSLSDVLRNPKFTYGGSDDGDGVGTLFEELLTNSRKWNAWGSAHGGTGSASGYSSDGGWGASNIRAVLNGVDKLTTIDTFAEANNISSNEALISAFPSVLQNAIGFRKTLYDSAYDGTTKTSYDRLWLLSPNEMTNKVPQINIHHPLEAPDGKYQKFIENNLNLSSANNTSFTVYCQNGEQVNYVVRYEWWLRSLSNADHEAVSSVTVNGSAYYTKITGNSGYVPGISPCFSLSRTMNTAETEPDKPIWVDYTIKPQTPISNTTFKLAGISDYGTDVVKIMTTDSFGRLKFDDVEMGTYNLTEIKSNDDFILNETIWKVRVNEDRSVEIYSEEGDRDRLYETGTDSSNTSTVIYNEPRYWGFTLRKVDKENETIWLEGAKFKLSGISDLGTEYDIEAESNSNGRVVFDRIEKGTYLLKELEAPSGIDENGNLGGNRNYIADNKTYVVTINHLGEVKIEGLTENAYDDFVVKNDRVLDGKITITKVWNDVDPSKRVAPKVHISTGEPEGLARVAITYDANGGVFEDGSTIKTVIARGTFKNGRFDVVSGDEAPILKEDPLFEMNGWKDENGNAIDKMFSDGKDKTVYANRKPLYNFFDKTKLSNLIKNSTTFGRATLSELEQAKAQGTTIINIEDESCSSSSILGFIKNSYAFWYSDSDLVYMPIDSSYVFGNSKLAYIHLNGISSKYTTKMDGMFNNIYLGSTRSLSVTNYSNFDTSNVVSMNLMFHGTRIAQNTKGFIESLDMSSVTSIAGFFGQSEGPVSGNVTFDLKNWDVSKVVDAKSLFATKYGNNISFDISGLNFERCEDMSYAFSGTSKMIITSPVNTSSLKIAEGMFRCPSNTSSSVATALSINDYSVFDFSNVENASFMFAGLSGSNTSQPIITILGADFSSGSLTTTKGMFFRSQKMLFDLSKLNTSNVIDMSSMFAETGWPYYDFSLLDFSSVQVIKNFFTPSSATIKPIIKTNGNIPYEAFDTATNQYAYNIYTNEDNAPKSPQIQSGVFVYHNSGWNTDLDKFIVIDFQQNTVSFTSQFSEPNQHQIIVAYHNACNDSCLMSVVGQTVGLRSIMASFDEGFNPVFLRNLFKNSGGYVESIDFSGLKTTELIDMSNMFASFGSEEIDLRDFKFNEAASLKNMNGMFKDNRSLKKIYVSSEWNINNNTSTYSMFENCVNLPNFSSQKIDGQCAHYGEGGYFTYKDSQSASSSKQGRFLFIDNLNKGLSKMLDHINLLSPVYAETIYASGNEAGVDWRIVQQGDSYDLIIGKENTRQEYKNPTKGVPDWNSYDIVFDKVYLEGEVVIQDGSGTIPMLFKGLKAKNVNLSGLTVLRRTVHNWFENAEIEELDLTFTDFSNAVSFDRTFSNAKINQIIGFSPSNQVNLQYTFSYLETDILDLSKINFTSGSSGTWLGIICNKLILTSDAISKVTSSQAPGSVDTLVINGLPEGIRLTYTDHPYFGGRRNLVTKSTKTLKVTGECNGALLNLMGFYEGENIDVDLSEAVNLSVNFQGNSKISNLNIGNNDFTGTTPYPTESNIKQFTTYKDIRSINIVSSPVPDYIRIEDRLPHNFYEEDVIKAGTYILSTLTEPVHTQDNVYTWSSIDELWKDNGDGTWSYVFDVFDDTLPYWYWEDDMEGYENNIPWIPGYKTTVNKQGTITNTSTDFGAIEISKTVLGTETNNKFDFTITLSGEGISGQQVFSDVLFTDGVGKLKLGHGETKKIEGIPAGATYLVEEAPSAYYRTTFENNSGTINTGETSQVNFTNTLRKLSDEQPERFVDITLKKLVTGTFEESGSYKVYGFFENLTPNMTYRISDGQTFTANALGEATVEVTITPETDIIFEDIPVGSRYRFTEEAGPYKASYQVTSNGEGNIAQSAGENYVENTELSTGTETADPLEEVTITFTNKLTKYQDLKVRKEVVGIQEDVIRRYQFEIKFTNMEPESYFNSDIGRIKADEYGEAMKGFELTDGQEVVFEHIPVGVKYKIKELANPLYAQYEITSENNIGEKAMATNENSSYNTDLSTEIETINEGENDTVTFKNIRKKDLTLTKLISGNMGNKLSKFTFTINLSGMDMDKVVISKDGVESEVTLENNSFDIELGHEDEIVIKDLLYTTEYTITEDKRDYEQEIKINNITAENAIGNMENDVSITFTNTKQAAIPTEVRFLWWGGIPLAIIPLVIFLVQRRKKKRLS